ncbi:MAG TPA: arylesterase [Vicinamibacterales bacterium]|nr:arylesterase [Vicinamibacterales bacterium]
MMLRPSVTCALFISLGLSLGCGSRESTRVDESSARTETTRPATPKASRPRIVALGDSLTAGLGLEAASAYPSVLQARLSAEGFAYDVVNAGVSGDTSAGGLSRLDWALDGDVRVLIVALGGNDGLRALPPEELEQNLATIIEKAEARHITVILAGMEAPPNFGRDYIVKFHRVYPELANRYHVAFVPFLLEGVAGSETLNQRDGIHPTAEGAKIVANNIWTVLGPIVAAHP